MWQNTCLSLSCKACLSYNAINFPKEALSLHVITDTVFFSMQWLMYMGRTCLSRQNWYQYQEHQHYGQINQPHGYLEKANLVLFLFASLVIFCVHMCMWYCKQRKLQYSCLTVNFTFGGKFPVCGSKWLPGLVLMNSYIATMIAFIWLFSTETFPVCGPKAKWLPGLAPRCWCRWCQSWMRGRRHCSRYCGIVV